MFCMFAARLTLRCRDQATSPLQSKTLIAMKPRMAPTTMKTVPSGRLLVCMYGAFAVGGTDGATTTYPPDKVGNPVRAPSLLAVVPVMTGAVEACPDVPDPVMTTPVEDAAALVVPVLLEPVFVAAAPVFAAVLAVVAVAVARSGKSVVD